MTLTDSTLINSCVSIDGRAIQRLTKVGNGHVWGIPCKERCRPTRRSRRRQKAARL